MIKKNVELSVVVPIFNEAENLRPMVEGLASNLDEVVGPGMWQYILVDNGSKDGSPEIIDGITREWSNSIKCHLDRPDYGDALYTGLTESQGAWVYIVNVDFWDAVFLKWSWRYRDRYDLILGSKRADPSINTQPRYRRTLSWGLNALLQFVFGFVGTDTHGQKFLRMATMRPILEQCVMRRGQFDTEFTLRAMRNGLWLAEVPVPIMEKRTQRNLMLKKIIQNVIDIFRLRRVVREVSFSGTIRYHRWAREDIEDGRYRGEIMPH
jgi:glycosyltransferase involved in cell wall biosynthesis